MKALLFNYVPLHGTMTVPGVLRSSLFDFSAGPATLQVPFIKISLDTTALGGPTIPSAFSFVFIFRFGPTVDAKLDDATTLLVFLVPALAALGAGISALLFELDSDGREEVVVAVVEAVVVVEAAGVKAVAVVADEATADGREGELRIPP